ncbi:hypothetical protein VNO77_05579 [Canavalia gladiata]|uniref:Uncharacterized protein n=1 Tax=Canavalia gladiata TaxID=3824 RepID=A0AAN9MZD3_CANGL
MAMAAGNLCIREGKGKETIEVVPQSGVRVHKSMLRWWGQGIGMGTISKRILTSKSRGSMGPTTNPRGNSGSR